MRLLRSANGSTGKVYLAVVLAIATLLLVNTVFRLTPQAPRIAVGDTPKVVLPVAPRAPAFDLRHCPKGWEETAGFPPPGAPSPARSFYTCRKDGIEVTIYDNGTVKGYDRNGVPLANPAKALK